MLQEKIVKELEQIPESKLTELYDLIHYFRLGLEKERRDNRTMQLAGAWAAPVAVLLNLDEYRRLQNQTAPDSDLLMGLSSAELQALSEGILAPALQDQLNDLLARNTEQQLSAEELAELDRLLDQVDQLTILKTRAKLTLSQQKDQIATR